MIGVLREELRESHSGGREEGMIRASLRGLKGSAKEQANVKSLLLLFALVPEDTHCPLEVLLLMFNAVHQDSGATVMHLRKWLRILLNRSLVLGTVDRPSLHDLVLDFVQAQHSPEALRDAHRRVVEAFRASRPADAYGRRRYDGTNLVDPISAYVCREGESRVAAGWLADKASDEVAVAWLGDWPQDDVVEAAGRVIGAEMLSELATRAESSSDSWLAARYWSVLASITEKRLGNMSEEATDLRVKSLDAIAALRSAPQTQATQPAEQDVEELHLAQVAALATGYDHQRVLSVKRPDEASRALATKRQYEIPSAEQSREWRRQCLS